MVDVCKQLRVLRIVSSVNPINGGVSNAVLQTIELLSKQNIKVELLCFDKTTSEVSNYKIFNLGKGFTAYKININYLLWLYQNAKNYDLVIFDGLWQFKSVGAYILRVLGVPYCVFVHGMLDPYFNKDLFKYFKKLPFWFLVERQMLSFADKVLFTCSEEEYLARKSFPLTQFNSAIVTLGCGPVERVNSANEFLNCYPELNNTKYILFLSRIHPKKGVDILLDGFAQSLMHRDGYHLVIAGPGEDCLINSLNKRAVDLGVNASVHWTGMLDGGMKWGAYHGAEAFVLPSHQENFGIVIAEALSTSTPVLTTTKVNIWKKILKSKAGLIDEDNVVGIKNILNRWFSMSQEKKQYFSLNAKNCFNDNFSIEAAKKDLESVLLQICKDKY